MQAKTPGVFIVEQPAFPNSVVEVATAVPAFIGFTEKASRGATSLLNEPTRISSLIDFIRFFGGPPKPTFSLQARAAPARTSPLSIEGASDAPDVPRAIFHVTDPTGAVSFEFVQTTPPFSLFRAMRLFFANGGGPCYVTSIGDYSEPNPFPAGAQVARAFTNAIDGLKNEPEPTLLVIPEAIHLPHIGAMDLANRMLQQCGEMKDRFAILDIPGGYLGRDDTLGDPVARFRDSLSQDHRSYGACYYPWLETSIYDSRNFTFQNVETASRSKMVELLKFSVASRPDLWPEIDRIIPPIDHDEAQTIDITLRTIVPLYKDMMDAIARQQNILPPSSAMAGIYTQVDATRGVWKAPANVSMVAVLAPTVRIDNDAQADLNAPIGAIAVNAIRTFAGRSVLVWGARTLDGNSADWRYVNVRRMMTMVEVSIRLAIKAFVFQPNTANTWIAIKETIGSFLTNLWQQGAFAGSTPEQAFAIRVGLGETMTAEDILEGIMAIDIMVAPVRPAEFIVLRIQQRMATS